MGDHAHRSAFLRLRRANGEWRVDPRLRPLLVEEARSNGGNLNGTINRILCAAYDVEYRPSGRPGAAVRDPDKINLTVQEDLHRKVRLAAARRGWSVQDEIFRALSEHFNLLLPALKRAA